MSEYIVLVDAREINQGIMVIYDDEDYHSAKIFNSVKEIRELAKKHPLLQACPYEIIEIDNGQWEIV